ncbi:RNA methyltransferase [Granulicella arctica]|uniref:tRNA/rRNA methyltransferase n=1 Tax=Granulicella arctica TaxID=940613 RepID=A0A7Y9TF93_9BACT|nr:TrmH family RNA methyltransferase [Granulicella arctica]NYF78476.1 tRNA/rRNA methyltransferase [Granulicella arctica]
MLTSEQLDRVVVVLVRARNPNNIGAVARAMHDFGFRHLRIVNDYAVPFHNAKSAVDASSVLEAAIEAPSVAEAIADCTLVIGTTAVGERDLNHPLHELPQAADLIRAEIAKPEGRVALLFGSEKTGLSNDELSHCNWLMTIPMYQRPDIRHPSMNLGQAAAVCLFELVRTAETTFAPASTNASAADLERLTTLLLEVLDQTEYTRRHPANCDPAQIRRLVYRMGLESTDAPIWMGILRQIRWKLGQSTEPAD